jgi:hypothetical protein
VVGGKRSVVSGSPALPGNPSKRGRALDRVHHQQIVGGRASISGIPRLCLGTRKTTKNKEQRTNNKEQTTKNKQQRTTINYRLSIIDYQLSIINC